ncbi:MAG: hypothetical protein L6Q98_19530 [Anaerolineae bacterium]|nr:hypothetical protein [Anaerolineae bacterium]NUQ07135.1 hypothetical protein [Anaerolineae bacterium]
MYAGHNCLHLKTNGINATARRIEVHSRRAHNVDASTLPAEVKQKINRLFQFDDTADR